jgi:hypothetical protein
VHTEKETWTEELPVVDHYQLQVEAFEAAVEGGMNSPLALSGSERTGRTSAALLAAAVSGETLRVPGFDW